MPRSSSDRHEACPAPVTHPVRQDWDSHVVEDKGQGYALLYVDGHLLDEHGSAQAFDGLRASRRVVRWPTATLAVVEHNAPTTDRAAGIADAASRLQIESTSGRLEDLRAAASIVRGRKVADHVRALVVPGSGLVEAEAEREGLDRVFRDAGFEWREPGCSMGLAMNADRLAPGERSASTSSRNFEGRQGAGGRTHLLSPQMAAAAAIQGCITDARELLR